jgi:hypothetical protein
MLFDRINVPPAWHPSLSFYWCNVDV